MITCKGDNGEVNAVEFKVISYASYECFCGVVLSQSIRVDTTSDSGSKQSRLKHFTGSIIMWQYFAKTQYENILKIYSKG